MEVPHDGARRARISPATCCPDPAGRISQSPGKPLRLSGSHQPVFLGITRPAGDLRHRGLRGGSADAGGVSVHSGVQSLCHVSGAMRERVGVALLYGDDRSAVGQANQAVAVRLDDIIVRHD